MTIIRTARPRTSMESGFAAGVEALRESLDAAEWAIGTRAPATSVQKSRWGHVEIALSMIDHPQDWRMLDLTISTNTSSDAIVDRWTATDPSLEIIALTREALDGVVAEWEPAEDEFDEIVVGLAWTLLDHHREDTVMIERGTPWSGARILTGLHDPDQLPSRPAQLHWTEREPRTATELAALAGMRLGTVIEPHGQDSRLRPLSRIIRTADPVEPMVRLRALAAWAEFDRGRS